VFEADILLFPGQTYYYLHWCGFDSDSELFCNATVAAERFCNYYGYKTAVGNYPTYQKHITWGLALNYDKTFVTNCRIRGGCGVFNRITCTDPMGDLEQIRQKLVKEMEAVNKEYCKYDEPQTENDSNNIISSP
jgi:hypothetical protein